MDKKYCLLFFLCLIVACGGLTGKQRTSSEEALKALKKIEAAIEIGVNFQNYNQLLIDARAKLNEAESTLPDGELKQELRKAFDSYNQVHSDWKLSNEINLRTGSTQPVLPSGVFNQEWSKAKKHIDNASKLLNQFEFYLLICFDP